MTESGPILSIQGVSKSYGRHSVIQDVCINISSGDIAIVLGANGAGKTTLIKLAVGLARVDKGKITFSGNSKFSETASYLGHESMLYQDLTVYENLELMVKLRGLRKTVPDILKEWQMEEFAEKRASELSRGMRYRAALSKSFIHDPAYIFLDEPSSALDQNSLEILSGKIKHAVTKKKGFAFIVTHDIERLSQIANRFIVLDQGTVAFDSDSLKDDLMTIRNRAVEFYHKTNR